MWNVQQHHSWSPTQSPSLENWVGSPKICIANCGQTIALSYRTCRRSIQWHYWPPQRSILPSGSLPKSNQFLPRLYRYTHLSKKFTNICSEFLEILCTQEMITHTHTLPHTSTHTHTHSPVHHLPQLPTTGSLWSDNSASSEHHEQQRNWGTSCRTCLCPSCHAIHACSWELRVVYIDDKHKYHSETKYYVHNDTECDTY